ncbi:hypothetical protein C3489_19715 [Streptomyces sp. Ru71]|uniref:hypothetical protein n=1 Tax=Streptomyces sp. Ru71 TaxID=2080746 RepID=UPI000CDD2336|nr:hypothetical protein [Streptomyces sp. Ru71]POX51695.1 hypothetical protein C3489_19715 [Streptomyces sp. Ru71]
MSEPVFVIHGVANRDRDGFTAAVASLEAATGIPMVPVYWGDLGAEDRFITAALPARDTARAPIVGAGGVLRDETPQSTVPHCLLDEQPNVPAQLEIIETALRDKLATDTGPLRDAPGLGRPRPDDIMDCLAEEWPDTRWLSRSNDAALLAETGRALAQALLDTDIHEDDAYGYDGLRGEPGRLRELVRRRLRDLDRVAGAAIGAVAGRMNDAVRTRFGPGTTRFLGDVLVYQRHRDAIHARVRARMDEVDPELGRGPENPLRVIAHSLGGVISVDMATARAPLWIEQLITFGSQPAFFHVCDPRGGRLLPYSGHAPVRLPASLARWTNLWEPLDMLAFAASKVFQLSDGSSPIDRPVPHAASTGLWTHSAYWGMPDVATAIAEVMGEVPADTD